MRAPQTKNIVFALVPVLLLLALASAAAEIYLRSRHASPASITGIRGWQLHESDGLTYAWDAYHPELGWTNAPGYRSDSRVPYEVTINAQGLRALREYGAEPVVGHPRIAFFGDSMVFGEEVDDDATLPFQLEQVYTGSEVLNFGVHGFGLGQMALRLEQEGFGFRPDHVVVGYLTYDLLRDPMRQYVHGKPSFSFEDGRLAIDNVPVPRDASLGWWARDTFVGAWLWQRIQRAQQSGSVEKSLPTLGALLARIRGACAEHGVPLTLVHLTDGYTIDRLNTRDGERQQIDLIVKTLASSGIDFLDLAPFLEQRYAEIGPSLLAPHGHWTGRGNRMIAEQIAVHLAKTAEPK